MSVRNALKQLTDTTFTLQHVDCFAWIYKIKLSILVSLKILVEQEQYVTRAEIFCGICKRRLYRLRRKVAKLFKRLMCIWNVFIQIFWLWSYKNELETFYIYLLMHYKWRYLSEGLMLATKDFFIYIYNVNFFAVV